jgi:NitT/TauT family transport system substrate-binding protein
VALVAALAVMSTLVLNAPAAPAAQLDRVTIGYSAWPGWLPLAVAQQAGIFEKDGLDVKLKYYADYVSSLDAMSAGKLTANAQTLNDTILALADASQQSMVVVNDNSSGNDAIVCDESITSVPDMRDKVVAAENGLTDHFLLLQGLAKAGLTQDDIDFRGVLTADAAASFADGQFDCVGVPEPYTQVALERPGSHVLFNAGDFPGTVPHGLVVSSTTMAKAPNVVQKIVNAWYDTLQYMQLHRNRSQRIMARVAKMSSRGYAELAVGTKILSVDDGLQAFQPGETVSSIRYTAGLVNTFMARSGVTKKEASLDQLFAPQFTRAYATAHHVGATTTSTPAV